MITLPISTLDSPSLRDRVVGGVGHADGVLGHLRRFVGALGDLADGSLHLLAAGGDHRHVLGDLLAGRRDHVGLRGGFFGIGGHLMADGGEFFGGGGQRGSLVGGDLQRIDHDVERAD